MLAAVLSHHAAFAASVRPAACGTEAPALLAAERERSGEDRGREFFESVPPERMRISFSHIIHD